MITLSSAENVLKDVYLGVIADQINMKTSPLYSKIKRSSRNIFGKEIRVAAPYGINGGIMAGTETGDLPESSERPYFSFVAELKNLYGRMEISDKAVRSSLTDVNSFVNLLQDGMDSLLQASVFNLSRMIYSNGAGSLGIITITDGEIISQMAGGILPGMHVDFYNNQTLVASDVVVTGVDKVTRKISINKNVADIGIATGNKMYVHNSKDNEILGLKAITGKDVLYGVNRSEHTFMNAHVDLATASDVFDEAYVQQMIDELEMKGTQVNFITSCYELKRLYQQYLTLYKKNIEHTTLENGTKVLSHMGIPIVPTGFLGAGECFFLNTDDFTFYELCDWRWLEDESGRVLKQHPTKPTYSATLVKYAELICQKPNGVGFCTGMPTTIAQ